MNRLIRSLCLACAGLFAAGLAQAETLRIGGKTFTEQRILTAITAQFLQKRGYDVTVTTGLGSTPGPRRPGKRPTGYRLGVHRLVADRLQPHRREARRRGFLPPGQATRRSPGPGLAEADPLQQHLCLGHARGTGRAPGHPERQRSRAGARRTAGGRAREHPPVRHGPGVRRPPRRPRPHERAVRPALHPQRHPPDGRRAGLHRAEEPPGVPRPRLHHRRPPEGFQAARAEGRQAVLPFYNAAPVVRKEVMQRHPEFATLFDPIIERLDDATMQALNARVDIEQQTPQKVAADFLREHHLLDDGQAGQGGSQ